jgi:hypothetical protein
MYTEEELIAFGKNCFYKGYDKAENDDANCYTAWREEANELIKSAKINFKNSCISQTKSLSLPNNKNKLNDSSKQAKKRTKKN